MIHDALRRESLEFSPAKSDSETSTADKSGGKSVGIFPSKKGRIAARAGARRQAVAWCRAQPIPAFGGRTAESLVKAGEVRALRDYLDGLE